MDSKNNEIITISREPCELYKVLKINNLASSGGEAKYFVAEGLVKLNGSAVTIKRKKIFSNDIIEFEGKTFIIKLG